DVSWCRFLAVWKTSSDTSLFTTTPWKKAVPSLNCKNAIFPLDGKVIGRGYNLRETTQDATTHAEMLAIKEACEKVGSWRLEDA
ncbi:deaminase, partial [Enterococcus faecium]|uniref:deaminase n=1 Tax=Enterococcus faecium TaxID=1352 RepID=UPI00292D690B